ncbi:hypothetical protein B0J11DRAFT_501526 [Dendryphion nanum]|uniref:Uncharacterized protein n=1 Tax=Dendryphion nanum TaxID=256645 RepID=A0A9P9J2X5_9PLEO|nr:hypothetical protein B0J11DRAFT_501526 [Dendryphion nanum]
MADTTVPSPKQSPLLLLPPELRLRIYSYLLLPSQTPSSTHSTSIANLLPSYHTYYSTDTNPDPYTLTICTIDPYAANKHGAGSKTWRKRSTFLVRTGPLTPLHPTSYRILLSPYTSHLRTTIPSLLPLCHQIHTEASHLLYSTYTFSFHANIEALVPFLSDLTPGARSALRKIQITKMALPYTREIQRAEWEGMCMYLAAKESGLALRRLDLSVIAGRPGEKGWDDIRPISKTEFEVLRRVQREWCGGGGAGGGVDLEWVEQLMAIRGLEDVRVKAVVEHCPQPRSEIMAFWVAFSKSVEGGFGEWVRGVMISLKLRS